MRKLNGRTLVGWVAVLLAAALGGQAPAPSTAPAAVGLHLQPTRWQTLPPQVRMVFIGSDHRCWLVAGDMSEVMRGINNRRLTQAQQDQELARVRDEVEKQWKQDTPTLTLSWPVLFEKGGRVWFVTPDRHALLGFDGNKWIEQLAHSDAGAERGFIGVCPGHGRPERAVSNVVAGDLCAFPESSGVTVFDGKQMSYQAYKVSTSGYLGPSRVFAEADGKGLVAVQALPPMVWRYRDGAWTSVTVTGLDGEIAQSALAADGTLYVKTTNALWQVTLGGPDAAAKKAVVNGIEVSQYLPGLASDQFGRVYISLVNLPESMAKTRCGCYVISAEKTEFKPDVAVSPQALVSDGGKTLWASSGLMGPGAARLDLTAMKPAYQSLGMPTVGFVQAVAGDGTVFLSAGDPIQSVSWNSGYFAAPMVAYKPGAADDRKVIRSIDLPSEDTGRTVASDGTAWAWIKDKGLSRFDGKDWTVMDPRPFTMLMAGQDGAVLGWGKGFTLFAGGQKYENAQLDELIRQNGKVFAAAFGGRLAPSVWYGTMGRHMAGVATQTGTPYEGGWSIAADKVGHVWLTINRTLRVLDGDKWVAAEWPEKATIKPVNPASADGPGVGPSYVLALGDGSAVYVCDQPRGWSAAKGKAFMATYADGKVKLEPAASPAAGLFRDGEGMLWVGQSTGQAVTVERLDAAGTKDKTTVAAMPVLLDASGYAWAPTGDTWGAAAGFDLIKDGKVAAHLAVQGCPKGVRTVFADKAGSVWIWTALGFQHWLAKDVKDPGSYVLAGTYQIQAASGEPFPVTKTNNEVLCSSKGFLLTGTWGDRPNGTQPSVHVIPLGE